MFKGCPNGEAKADLMVCVCFLRTQQCAKSQCIKRCTTPVGIGFRIGSAEIISEEIAHGWVAGFRRVFRGLAGVSHSTESLILAQDERWRRA